MKVLLINPPIRDFYFTFQRNYPLNLLYLGSMLKTNGIEVKILNSLEKKQKVLLHFPKKFNYLKRYYQKDISPFCLFSDFYHFGLTYEEIFKMIKEYNPDIVGISCNFSCYFDTARSLAKLVKKIDKRITVVMGGRFATIMPEFILKNKDIDFIIRGEAEEAFVKFCLGFLTDKFPKKEVCFKTQKKIYLGKINLIENLNTLVLPERELINYKNYRYKELISTSLTTSRGCRFKCNFCGIREKYRFFEKYKIIEEIDTCFNLGIRHFNFEDDNFNLHPDFEEILEILVKKYAGKIKISFMNGLINYKLNPKTINYLEKLGLTHLDFSLVSANNLLRKKLKRTENKNKLFLVADYLNKKKIPIFIHTIIGLPSQTFRMAFFDLKMLAKKSFFLGISIFYPVIESKLFKLLKEKFSVKEENFIFFRSSSAYFDKALKRDEIFSLFYYSRLLNFLKILKEEFKIKKNIFYFIENKMKELNLKVENNKLISFKKLSRKTIGIFLLNKFFKEKKAYRVQEFFRENNYIYYFKEINYLKKLNSFLSWLKKNF